MDCLGGRGWGSLKDSRLGALTKRSFMRDAGIPSTYSLVPSSPPSPFLPASR